MRTALSEVKEELGADAVIMSNKKVTGGVEIVAAVDTDIANEPPKASQNTRDALANRLGQAKRKLAARSHNAKRQSPSLPRTLGRFWMQSDSTFVQDQTIARQS